MSLLTVCEAALKEISEFNVPDAIVGNDDPTAVTLLALANRSGRALARDFNWQVLLTTHTFPTVISQSTYDLPDDFARFANLTQWDRTNLYDLKGPVSPMVFEALRSGNLVGAGFTKYFRVAGNKIEIYPTPTAVETLAYQYISKNWVDNGGDGLGDLDAYEADDHAPVFDEDLMALDLKWRFLKAKGWDYADDRDEFNSARDSLLASDGGKGIIRLGRPVVRTDGLPEQGFG